MTKLHRMKRKGKRDIEAAYTAKQFAEKLRRLADAIETNQAFTISVAGERLRIPAGTRFNIEHGREGKDEELEFQLLWRNEPAKAVRPARKK